MKRFGTAAILAGGKSTRMGFDKQLLKINDRLIYQNVFESLTDIFSDIAVVTNTPNLYEASELRVCSDEFLNMGPLSGIHITLKTAQSEYVYLLACDMPIVNPRFVSHMMRRVTETGAEICVTKRNGKIEPFNAFYKAELVTNLEARLQSGNTSLYDFITSSNVCVISEEEAQRFDSNLDMYINLNTQGDYHNYLKKVSGK